MVGLKTFQHLWYTRRELSSSFLFLQGKVPKEIHAILTETLLRFLHGRAKDLSAPLYNELIRHSPVIWMRPTFRLTTASCVNWWCVLQRYDRMVSLAVMLRIMSSPEGSMWYLPSERNRNMRNVRDFRLSMLKIKVCPLHVIICTDGE